MASNSGRGSDSALEEMKRRARTKPGPAPEPPRGEPERAGSNGRDEKKAGPEPGRRDSRR